MCIRDRVEGLDDLKDQLSEDFEKWSNELSANLEKMSQAIADAVKNVGNNTADAMLSIGKILEQFGIKAGDLGISAEDLNVSGLKKYHNGAKRVGKDVLAVTNDGGREIIVTKQGVITPMKSSDGVIPNNMTETLMDMAAFWQNPNFPKYTDTVSYTHLDVYKRQLKDLKEALRNKEYEKAEKMTDKLIEDTQKGIEDN